MVVVVGGGGGGHWGSLFVRIKKPAKLFFVVENSVIIY